jgi:hypothetical protein
MPDLEKNLKLLVGVIRGIRSKLTLPERKRREALEDYHGRNLNAKRRAKQRTIERAYRGIFKPRLRELERAARRAFSRTLKPARSNEEKKILRTMRRRFEKAVKMKVGVSVILELTGVTLPELRRHLAEQFKPGMTWENYGIDGWHIDHKRPCASFNLADPEQQKVCFHYTNLQPLWAAENMAKGAHLCEAEAHYGSRIV